MSKTTEMPLLGGPLHGVTADKPRVTQAIVPTEHVVGDAFPDPDAGLYVPTKFAMCGRIVTVGLWERLSESERDDLMWEYLASDAAKTLGRTP